MGIKPETKLQTKIRKSLEDRGAWVVKFHGSPYTRGGTPDLLICYKGRFIGMEVKMPGEEDSTTDLQLFQIMAIKKAKGIALVITSVVQANKLFDLIDEKLGGNNEYRYGNE